MIVIRDKLYINTNELGFKVSKLCELFTYKNPDYMEKKRLKLSVKNIQEFLFHYKIETIGNNQMLVLPRGGLDRVKQFYLDNNLTFEIKDKRISHRKIDVELLDTKLEKQQIRIIKTLVDNEGGLIQALTGIGKSISILGLISQIKQPTLIIVDEFRLSNQWLGEIKKRLTGKFKLGVLNGDQKIDGDIVVAIIDSCSILYEKDPKYFDKFGMIILDESHVSSSPSYLKVVNNLSAKYRVGVTATVKRKDGMHILTIDMLGKVLLDIDANEAKERVTNFEFKIVNTNIKFEIPGTVRWTGRKREPVINFAKCIEVITQDNQRNNIIINEVSKSIEEGYFPLILSDRVEHNKLMAKKLQELGYNAILLIGDTRKKAKWEDIQKDTSIQCIVANTSIASKGLDLPRLSSLHLTCPSSNQPQLKQRIGRIRRFVKNKPLPIVYDYVDNLGYFNSDNGVVPLLQLTALKRLRYYKQLQKDYLQNPDEEQLEIT